ncbi:MAG: hypothetical protein HKN25_10565 [Pyrinomonadaceae bacterium]|nr:hypothetical protein [Pyrinomonadaceae bacterium]
MNGYLGKKGRANSFSLIAVLLILLGATLGCLGPSASDSRCEGVVSIGGKKYTGRAKDEKQARLNSCNKFCIEEDEKAKGMVADWLASDKAKSFEKTYKRKAKKEDAVIEDKRILDYVTRNCATRCVSEANKGKHKLRTSCKK